MKVIVIFHIQIRSLFLIGIDNSDGEYVKVFCESVGDDCVVVVGVEGAIREDEWWSGVLTVINGEDGEIELFKTFRFKPGVLNDEWFVNVGVEGQLLTSFW